MYWRDQEFKFHIVFAMQVALGDFKAESACCSHNKLECTHIIDIELQLHSLHGHSPQGQFCHANYSHASVGGYGPQMTAVSAHTLYS